ncbi:endonuclease domain-containing protein [Halalkalibacter urbisdiaboli]|uniref:endonuclease domain-containing protein n=1 Tax=Halalkalibacter urbisdiaboli TaxID=1960589 RepID=UPI000B441B52|nr:DUF559 domain-containing protein [Halalkalibacter urbisdiaboli]
MDYVIFFGLIAVCLVLFVLHERKPKPSSTWSPRHQCESPIERRLYDALVSRGYVPRTQVPCGKYRIDLALVPQRIAIECDGRAYHSSPRQKAHDRRKNAYLRRNGWRVVRFSGSRIHRDINGILRRIEKELT